MSAEPPRIGTLTDLDSGEITLTATSYGQTAAAGPRLFRAPPHPDIRFSHTSQAEADADAKKLQDYINEVWAKRVSKERARRDHP